MSVIKIQDLDVKYGHFHALKKVSFSVEGGAVGLLGPNGAGKTTLFKTLLGFVRPQGGTAEVFGLSMPERYLEVRQKLGYMPEKEVVSPKISAVAFLTYCGRLFGMTRTDAMERSHEVLNYVGMGDNRYRKTETYSTGMLQRVKLGAALIHDPDLLLLDEPTNGLDPDGRNDMLELIRDLAVKREVTVVLSSHLLPDVEFVCDHLVMINRGEIVRVGGLEEITSLKEGLYEVRVRENKDAFTAALRAKGCSIQREDEDNILIAKPEDLSLTALFELAKTHNTQLRHLRAVRFSLEEAFMQALGK